MSDEAAARHTARVTTLLDAIICLAATAVEMLPHSAAAKIALDRAEKRAMTDLDEHPEKYNTEEHEGLPVHGYRPQSDEAIALVNTNKVLEERILRMIDDMQEQAVVDGRWSAIARTHFEQGFMALNRSIFQPERLQGDLD